jgi:protein-S-isoprenylcysteine O-methyltransferase Ste14
MRKSFAWIAGVLAYLLITLEMLFMISPFALYYYSIYGSLLAKATSLPATAWMPAFFLPHLSSEIIPSIRGLIFLTGLAGFFVNAFQLYYAKFRKRGVVQSWFYKRIRHPQYLFLALSGLGLLIVWPRFILLVAYINMLWLYYLLARDEERRMDARYGETYREHRLRTSMFLPGEPGGRLQQWLFGWIRRHRIRLFAIYGLSLAGAIGAAFLLRGLSLHLVTRLSLRDRKIAAVSFLSGSERQLREIIESAEDDEKIRSHIEGHRPVVHVMIDAGMTRSNAKNLPLAEQGINLVFSRRKDTEHKGPFSTRARWQPILIAGMKGEKISRVLDLDQGLFLGNPVMPVF